MNNARFITLEGIEGVGKSTHIPFISDFFKARGFDVCVTREPGGTELGEAIREILLHAKQTNISAKAELLLMFAARHQHIQDVIVPAMERGEIVICDRFTDASYAYQGGGRGLTEDQITLLENWVQGELSPDLTILLDAQVSTGMERLGSRGDKDRFEDEDGQFFEKVRNAYLARARAEPQRVKLIDAQPGIPEVEGQIRAVLESLV